MFLHNGHTIGVQFPMNLGKLLCSYLCSSVVGWARCRLDELLTVVFGFIPGLPYCRPRTPLSLPGISRRLHGDGSAWVLLHLLITKF